MQSYKRKITYFCQFQNGNVGSTAGFLKLEIRGDKVKIIINIQEPPGLPYKGAALYFYHEAGDHLAAIQVDEIESVNGSLAYQNRTDWQKLFDTDRDLYTFDGVAVVYNDSHYYIGDFKDKNRKGYELVKKEAKPQMKKNQGQVTKFRISGDNRSAAPAGKKQTVADSSADRLFAAVGNSVDHVPTGVSSDTIGKSTDNLDGNLFDGFADKLADNSSEGRSDGSADKWDDHLKRNVSDDFADNSLGGVPDGLTGKMEAPPVENSTHRPAGEYSVEMAEDNAGMAGVQMVERAGILSGSQFYRPGTMRQKKQEEKRNTVFDFTGMDTQEQKRQEERQTDKPQNDRHNSQDRNTNPEKDMGSMFAQCENCPYQKKRTEQREEYDSFEKMIQEYPKLPMYGAAELFDCVRIHPKDIGKLDMRNWKLGVNSFLTHGFYTYQYLLLGKVRFDDGSEHPIIGVPGIFSNREKYLANMFGFEQFIPVKKTGTKTGQFGYWIVEISQCM